jgi:hypothetical protein
MKIINNWNTNFALHYTKGKGFYENYNEKDGLFVDAIVLHIPITVWETS